jgi:hypothetical protein
VRALDGFEIPDAKSAAKFGNREWLLASIFFANFDPVRHLNSLSLGTVPDRPTEVNDFDSEIFRSGVWVIDRAIPTGSGALAVY